MGCGLVFGEVFLEGVGLWEVVYWVVVFSCYVVDVVVVDCVVYVVGY